MSLIRRHEPASNHPASRLQQEMNQLFDSFFTGSFPSFGDSTGSVFHPAITLSETPAAVNVRAELPGLESKDIDIQVEDNVLTISGEKKHERKEEKENFHLVEHSYGSFQRKITLPTRVDSEAAQASLENGVLSLRLPKLVSKASKQIPIK